MIDRNVKKWRICYGVGRNLVSSRDQGGGVVYGFNSNTFDTRINKLLLMWDTNVLELVDFCINSFSVSVVFRKLMDGMQWLFSGVYSPNDDGCRSLLHDELASVCNLLGLSRCIGGDFNVTRILSERSGGGGLGNGMVDFSYFISEFDLLYVLLTGGVFTWSNNRASQLWSRIDHFLFSPSWDSLFLEASQNRLSRLFSDYFLILLESDRIRGGKRHFHFENMWLKENGFVDHVKEW